MTGTEVKARATAAGVKLWEVAKAYGVADTTFSKYLRGEFTETESTHILDIISELAGYLADNKRELIPEKLDWIYHSTACRAAIKAGDSTTQFELEKFVENLLSQPDIRYCPHGRPVLIEMSKKEIEKSFGRIQ